MKSELSRNRAWGWRSGKKYVYPTWHIINGQIILQFRCIQGWRFRGLTQCIAPRWICQNSGNCISFVENEMDWSMWVKDKQATTSPLPARIYFLTKHQLGLSAVKHQYCDADLVRIHTYRFQTSLSRFLRGQPFQQCSWGDRSKSSGPFWKETKPTFITKVLSK